MSVCLLIHPALLASPVSREISEAAAALGLNLKVVRASDALDLATAFTSLTQMKVALVIGSNPFFSSPGVELGRLTLSNRIPAIYQYPQFAAAGGLMSYGATLRRILKGGLSTCQSRKSPKSNSLSISKRQRPLASLLPSAMLERADEVIE